MNQRAASLCQLRKAQNTIAAAMKTPRRALTMDMVGLLAVVWGFGGDMAFVSYGVYEGEGINGSAVEL